MAGVSYASESGWTLSASNGGAEGLFQLDGWDMYFVACSNGFTGYVPLMVSTGGYCEQTLVASGTYNDANEPTSITCGGYPSLNFYNGYNCCSNENSYYDCNGQGSTYSTQTESVEGFSLQISIGGYTSISGSASFTTSQIKTFSYTFGPNGDWIYQWLGSGQNSNWSFAFLGCYGGGGCVLRGTQITLATGTQISVQNLKAGDKVLSYNINTGKLVTTTVTSNNESQVTHVLDINDGQLFASGLGDQPMYVHLQNGTKKAIALGQLATGMQLYDPAMKTWVPVTSLQIINGTFSVYDLRTSGGYYIANGILTPNK